jgi:hypothetical protein
MFYGGQRDPLVQCRTRSEYLAPTGLVALLDGLAINIAPLRGWDMGIGDEDPYKVQDLRQDANSEGVRSIDGFIQ